MRDLFRLANDIQSFCRERGWKFCFIGGLALQRWGEPRLTGDVDLTILTGFGAETAYIEQLCRAFPGRRRTSIVSWRSRPGHWRYGQATGVLPGKLVRGLRA